MNSNPKHPVTTAHHISRAIPAGLAKASQPAVTIQRNYKPTRYDLHYDADINPDANIMHKEAQWIINDILNKVRPRRWLTLLGPSGTGKTHLAKAIRNVVTQERPNLFAQFWTWANVATKYRDGYYDIIDYLIREPDVLVIDDIGAENVTESTRSNLLRLADSRLGKWTIWTSNMSTTEINDRIDPRLASRLFRGDNVVVQQSPNAQDYEYSRRSITQ